MTRYQFRHLNIAYLIVALFAAGIGGCQSYTGYVLSREAHGDRADCGDLTKEISVPIADGVFLHLHARDLVGLNVSARIGVPSGSTVRLDTEEFVFESEEFGGVRKLPVIRITGDGPKEFAPIAELPNKTAPKNLADGAKRDMASYTIWFFEKRWGATGLPAARSFVLRPPSMWVNGRQISVSPIALQSCTRRVYVGLGL